MTYEQAIANGQTCFEHLTGIGTGHLKNGAELPQIRRLGSQATIELRLRAQELLASEIDMDAVRRLASHLAERQIWNCPTSTVWIRPAQMPDEAMRDPNLRYMRDHTVTDWHQRVGAGAGTAGARRREAWVALQRVANEVRFQALKLLLDEGAPLLLGTDSPNPFVIPGFAIHEELANLVSAGFSPFQALRCGTSETARFMNEADEWGTVAEGRHADLLLLSANPLMDVAAVARPEAVFVNGFYLTRNQLDSMLEERAVAVGAKLSPPELGALAAGASIVRSGKLQNTYDAELTAS